jgi:hypothetical protein
LSRVNTPDVNVLTAEDPVEYNLDGINQVLVNEDAGLTFAAALKAFLRQDPNVIMVGEIRDIDTGLDRGQGGAHGPPRAVDAPHNDAPQRHRPTRRHGHRAVSRVLVAESGPRTAPRTPHLLVLQAPVELSDEVLTSCSSIPPTARALEDPTARAAPIATTPATADARASTK